MSNREQVFLPNIVWQPLCATVFMVFVIYVLGEMRNISNLTWAIGSSSLSSSCFIVFGGPSKVSAQARSLLGGYVIAIVSGLLVQAFIHHFILFCHDMSYCPSHFFASTLAAIVVGIVLVLMVKLRCYHPPAAGMALVTVIDIRDYRVVLVVFAAVICLTLVRVLLRNYLRDLFV